MSIMPPGEGFLGLETGESDPDSAGCVIVPVPFERTSTFGPGSARGPAAILHASHEVELFDAALGFDPSAACGGVLTDGFVDIDGCDGPAVAERLEAVVGDWIERGKFVVTVGGEHTSVVGAVRAHAGRYPDLTVVQVDAHSDLRQTYLDNPWNHACAMARVLDFHDHLVQVGIRSQCAQEKPDPDDPAIVTIHAHEIDPTNDAWLDRVVGVCRPNVYITFDCDALDPSIMPATGTPEPDGLGWRQADGLLARLCTERTVVGFDLSELAPLPGLHHPQFTAAKLLYRLIGRRFVST